jgi:WD40 repeat protein
MQFSRDGKTLALACDNSTIRLLNARTGTEKRSIQDPMHQYSTITMSLSPDGQVVAMTHRSYRQVVLWDAETGILKRRITNVGTYSSPPALFTPDSSHFVNLWIDGRLHLIETSTGKSVRNLEPSIPTNMSQYLSRVTSVILSRDGKQLIYRPGSERSYRIVDLATAKEVRRWERPPEMLNTVSSALALTPNGRFLVEAGNETALRVWGIASGKQLRELSVPTSGSLSLLALSPDGKLAASVWGQSIYVWDVAAAKRLHDSGGHQSSVTRLAFTPDGKQLISVGGSTMRAWDTGTGRELHLTRPTYSYGFSALTTSSDSKVVRWLAADRALYQWKIGDAGTVRLTNPKTTPYYSNQAVSPDGKLLAGINTTDRKLRLIDLLGNRPDRELTIVINAYSNQLSFSPDGRILALGAANRVVTLFDVSTGAEIRKLAALTSPNNYGTPAITFSPDSRSLLKFDNGELRVIETASGGERLQLPREAITYYSQLVWSDNGRLVARAQSDGWVMVYDTFTGRELFRRQTGQGAIYGLAFSRDGRKLATGGANTTALIWTLPLPGLPRAYPDDETAWRDLEDLDASRAFKAIAHLSSQPTSALKLFQTRLKPRPPVDAKRIDQLIKELDDESYAVRERASEELGEVGSLAEAALKVAARRGSLEVQHRARDLLRRLKGSGSIAPERLRARRAVEVLERIGTPAARRVLENMLKMKLDATLEASIKGCLERMGS